MKYCFYADTLYDTLDNDENTNSSNEMRNDQQPRSPQSATSTNGDENRPSKKRKLLITDYLCKKLEMDDARNKQKEEFQKRKWEEEKALKEKEINAILELVKVLAQKPDK